MCELHAGDCTRCICPAELRLKRIERPIPYLFRPCAILATFQVVVFLIAVGVI